jgi:hypothetical protein
MLDAKAPVCYPKRFGYEDIIIQNVLGVNVLLVCSKEMNQERVQSRAGRLLSQSFTQHPERAAGAAV